MVEAIGVGGPYVWAKSMQSHNGPEASTVKLNRGSVPGRGTSSSRCCRDTSTQLPIMDTPAVEPGAGGTGYTSEIPEDAEPRMVEHHEDDAPTASHALADESLNDESTVQGASQVEHDDVEVHNLGWNEEAPRVPRPVVGGLTNEQLWTLIRRFDKQVFHVKSIDTPPLANLDMNIADEEEFSPDKLRANLERLYITVVVPVVSFWKHIARLRSWKEYQRTSAFLAIYTVAWLLDLLIPTLTAFALVLILYPSSRETCFPPAPPALIDSKTGGVQKPKAGVLATDDTLTGAPEKHEGEAVEQEAHSFVNSIATVCLSVPEILPRVVDESGLIIFSPSRLPLAPPQASIHKEIPMMTAPRPIHRKSPKVYLARKKRATGKSPARHMTRPRSQSRTLSGTKLARLCISLPILSILGSDLGMPSAQSPRFPSCALD